MIHHFRSTRRPNSSSHSSLDLSGRRGSLLMECIVACAVLSILLVCVGQFLTQWNLIQRGSSEQRLAVRELESQIERLKAPGGPDLLASGLTISPDTASSLNQALLKSQAGAPDSAGWQPVTLTLVWTNAQGQQVRPTSLTTWIKATAQGKVSP